MRKKIKIGVIGCGIWGEKHAKIFSKSEYSKLVAVCDIKKEKAKSLAKTYSVNYYKDFNRMFNIEELDGVSIATPDFAHAKPLLAAAGKGLNILCEKPLVISEKELDKVIKVVNKNNIRIMVDYHNRWNPPFSLAKEKIDKGEIGTPINGYMRLNDKILVPKSYITWAEKSSVIWFLGSHTVDTLSWLFNDRIKRVYSVCREGILKKSGINTVDVYQSTLEFEKGGIAQIENGWITPDSNPLINDFKCNILCTKGMINLDLSSSNFFEIYYENKIEHPDFFITNSVFDEPKGFSFESIKDFVRKLYFDEEFIIQFEDSINVNKVLFKILESSKKHEPIEIVY